MYAWNVGLNVLIGLVTQVGAAPALIDSLRGAEEYTVYSWNLEPTLILGLLAQAGAYVAFIGPLRHWFPDSAPVSRSQIQLFMLGVLTLFVALVSPVDTLGEQLLTMHMVQHMLLTLVAPPLLLAGTPRWLFRPLLRLPFALPIGRLITSPLVVFIVFNVAFAIWHVPAYYDRAVESLPVHILEHVIFIVTATLTWWPIFSPMDELPASQPIVQCAYLFFQTLPPTILGAMLTFASAPLYRSYAEAPGIWGLDPLTDQQLAGLLMWVPGSLIFFAVMSVIFIRWMNRDEFEVGPAMR